jgi:hypothetical protein
MARDSVLWTVGIIGAIVIGLAANFDAFPWIPVTAQHWISLAAFIAGIISAKLATSPLPSKRELAIRRAAAAREQPLIDPPLRAGRVDVKKLGKPVIIALLLVGSSSCASSSVRHQATVASTGLYTAIAAIDDTERALATSGALTADQHAKLTPDILLLLKAGRAANDAVIATTVPQPVQNVVTALAAVANHVTELLPDGPTKSKLQTAIIGAQTAATLLLAFRTTQIGANDAREPEHHPALGPGRPADRPDRGNRVLAFTGRAAGEWDRRGHRAA